MKKVFILIMLLTVSLCNNIYSQSFSLGNSTNPLNVNNSGLKSVEKSIAGAIGQLHNIGYTIPNLLTPAIDSFTDLNIQTLRFPVTDFNLYHFGINKKGYGFNYDEVYWNRDGIDGTNSSDRATKVQNLINSDGSYSSNIIDLFIESVHQTEQKNNSVVAVIYTLNIWQHFRNTGGIFNFVGKDKIIDSLTSLSILPGNPLFNTMLQENLDAIQYLLDNGINVIGVEFDNEPYYWPLICSVDPLKLNQTKINNYITVCNAYNTAIKQLWPNIKSAIPIEHYGGPNGNLFNAAVWANNFYDAFSIHHYSGPEERNIFSICVPLGPFTSCNDILKYINNGINGTGSTPNCGKQLSSRLSTFDSKNKEYWILEWNTGGQTQINNSILHADYYYKMMFTEFSTNSRIKNCIYWASSMVNNGPTLPFNPWQLHWAGMMRHSIVNENNWFINKQATYYPAQYFSKQFTNNMKLINNYDWNNWSNTGNIPAFIRTNFSGIDKNNFFIRPYIQTLSNPLSPQILMSIYFSNMSNKTITIDYENFNINTPYPACGANDGKTIYTFKPTQGGIIANYYDIAKISYIKTDAFAWGLAYEPERWYNNKFTSSQIQGGYNYNNTNIIPPYSVGIIELTLSANPVDCGGTSNRLYNQNTINDIDIQKNNLNIFPNPTKDIINFNFNSDDNRIINIYNLEGKQILSISTKIRNNEINLKHLSKGTYLYSIISNFENINGKFILQ